MNIDSCYKIGYVAKTHGLKGELTIVVNESIQLGKTTALFVDVGGTLVPYFIERVSDRGDKAFIKLEDVDNPEQAKDLKGCSLYLPRKVRPKLVKGAFYDDEVLGFKVEDEKLGLLGEIREVVQIGPNRLLVINRPTREILIPIQGPFIQSINKSKKKVKVDLPEGFLDI
jgi:16S rRNA processing protein RimM